MELTDKWNEPHEPYLRDADRLGRKGLGGFSFAWPGKEGNYARYEATFYEGSFDWLVPTYRCSA